MKVDPDKFKQKRTCLRLQRYYKARMKAHPMLLLVSRYSTTQRPRSISLSDLLRVCLQNATEDCSFSKRNRGNTYALSNVVLTG